MGVQEMALATGMWRQRVDELTRREDFPVPLVHTAGGRAWEVGEVRAWFEGRGRVFLWPLK